MDQCEHCECRGYLEFCEKTDCSILESWYAKELNLIIWKLEKVITRQEKIIFKIEKILENNA